MDLENAIRLEVGWGMRFRQAIRSGEQFYVEIIGHDDCCDFGRWLYRDAVGPYGHLPQLMPCIEAHAAFHGQAALVGARHGKSGCHPAGGVVGRAGVSRRVTRVTQEFSAQ